MTTSFDPSQFVRQVGERLVLEFELAGRAGTPGLVGAAREHPARVQLANLMPALVSAGSGLLMDSFGSRSTQQDIVLYERDFCPVYSINNTPEATYYPVEGVIAAGEIKSVVSKIVLFDALNKLRSAKKLIRHSEKEDSGIGYLASFRAYGSGLTLAPGPREEFNQAGRFRDQLYTFILCGSFASSPEAVLDNLIEYQRMHGHDKMPNLIVSLADGFVQGMKSSNFELQYSPVTSDSFSYVPANDRAFAYLVNDLKQHVREGRTVPLEP